MTKADLNWKRTAPGRTRSEGQRRRRHCVRRGRGPGAATSRRRRGAAFDYAVCGVLAITAALGAVGSAHAAEGGWTVRLEPVFMEVHGHDQHVLTIHEVDLDSTPVVDSRTAVTLDSDSGLAYRGEFQYHRGQWGVGVDFLWFNTTQLAPSLRMAAGTSAAIDQVVFEVADRSFTSSGPGETLLYERLEDTDLALWTLDVYGIRTLTGNPESGLRLQLGLRVGDFDNDYRAVVGIAGVGGSRIDASSNYGLMIGPLVGLAGTFEHGRNSVGGYIGQSVLLGSPELSNSYRDFIGATTDMPPFLNEESFRSDQDVAIPITELRLNWTYEVTRHLAVSLGASSSAWWDVPVPPGVIPGEGGDQALHENTLVLFGLLGGVELTF